MIRPEPLTKPLCSKYRANKELEHITNIMTFVYIMVVLNLCLIYGLFTYNKMVVLVPTLDKEFEVNGMTASYDYLKDRTEQILQLLFSMNAENEEHNTKQLLKNVGSSDVKEIKAMEFAKPGHKYYAVDYEINTNRLIAKVKVHIESRAGVQIKFFKLIYNNDKGFITLSSIKEVSENEQITEVPWSRLHY